MRHKCLASFVVLLLFISVQIFVIAAEIRTLTRPENILRTLASSGIYENLPKYLEIAFSSGKDVELQAKMLSAAIAQSINPVNLRTEVEKNLPPLINYFNGRAGMPNISIDLRPFKKELEKNIPEAVIEELKNLEPCPPGTEMSNEQMPNCLPQGTTPQQLQDALLKSNSTDEIISQIPDSYGLQNLKNPEKTFSRAILAFNILKYTYWGSLIFSLLLLGLLVLLGRGYWPAVLRWTGVGLLLPGATMLFLTLLSLALPAILIGKYGAGLDPEVIKVINPMITAFNRASQNIALLYSGITSGLGFVLILLSYIIPHPPEPKPEAKPAAPAPAVTP